MEVEAAMEEEEVMALSSAGTLGQVCSLQIKLIISILLEKRDIDISIILRSLYRVFQGEI